MSYLKVEGHSGLFRDPKTNSIVNQNATGYNEYISQKNLRDNGNDKIDNMKDDLDNLKNEINEIKSLLKELVNG